MSRPGWRAAVKRASGAILKSPSARSEPLPITMHNARSTSFRAKQWGLGAKSKVGCGSAVLLPFHAASREADAAGGVGVVLRTEGDPAAVMGPVRRAVAQLDRRDVICGVQNMDAVVVGSFAARRVSMLLFPVFAALALVSRGRNLRSDLLRGGPARA
jgi:hypothetical protein